MEQVHFTAESREGHTLTDTVKNKIANLGLQVDADFVAEYVTVLVCNNKHTSEITNELADIVGTTVSNEFAEWVYNEAKLIQNNGVPADIPTAKSAFPSSHLDGTVASKHAEIADTSLPVRSAFFSSNASSKKRDTTRGAFKSGSGVTKKSSERPKLGGHTIGRQISGGNLNILKERLNERGNSDSQRSDSVVNDHEKGEEKSDAPLPRKQRCRHWPYCNYPQCQFPHPYRDCKLYPDCPNPDGVCPFLHPSDPRPEQLPTPEEIEKYWQRKRDNFVKETREFKNMKKEAIANAAPTIQLCKYAEKCANNSCPYAHPTPANDSAKVMELVWCENKEQCSDPSCPKGHPSASLVRDPTPIPTHVLETCRFAWNCSNPRCRYRHPRSMVPCRNGVECQRVDCSFFHPIQEQCKFGANCRNAQCVYLHPEGRDEALKGGSSTTSWVKNERSFTDGAQPMETVLPGSGDIAMEQA